MDNRRLLAMVISLALGTVAFFWSYLHIAYRRGANTHRKAIPFFLGLILGEGSIWSLIGIITNHPMYRFLY